MKTVTEQETEAILKIIGQMTELQKQLDIAKERIAFLEAQIYGGSTK
jgi:hypothetical protein